MLLHFSCKQMRETFPTEILLESRHYPPLSSRRKLWIKSTDWYSSCCHIGTMIAVSYCPSQFGLYVIAADGPCGTGEARPDMTPSFPSTSHYLAPATSPRGENRDPDVYYEKPSTLHESFHFLVFVVTLILLWIYEICEIERRDIRGSHSSSTTKKGNTSFLTSTWKPFSRNRLQQCLPGFYLELLLGTLIISSRQK